MRKRSWRRVEPVSEWRYLEAYIGDREMWGGGADSSVLMASFKAMIAAVNRSASEREAAVLSAMEQGSRIAN